MAQFISDSELTIFNANEQKAKFLDFLNTGSDLEINLSHVEEMDTAGLQLLILCKRQAAQQGKLLRFVMHSKEILNILELTNLTGVFGDQVVLVRNEG